MRRDLDDLADDADDFRGAHGSRTLETMDIDAARALLGVSADASMAEIKQAWRDLAKVWHPDRFQNDGRLQSKAAEKLKELNAAFALLSRVVSHPSAQPPGSERPQQRPQADEREPSAQPPRDRGGSAYAHPPNEADVRPPPPPSRPNDGPSTGRAGTNVSVNPESSITLTVWLARLGGAAMVLVAVTMMVGQCKEPTPSPTPSATRLDRQEHERTTTRPAALPSSPPRMLSEGDATRPGPESPTSPPMTPPNTPPGTMTPRKLETSRPLKRVVKPADTRPEKSPPSATFGVGATARRVQSAQGDPDRIVENSLTRETWYWGRSSVTFERGVVVDYRDLDGKLRVK